MTGNYSGISSAVRDYIRLMHFRVKAFHLILSLKRCLGSGLINFMIHE